MKYYKDSKEFPLFNYIRIVDTKDFFYVIKGYDGEAIEGADIKECEEKFNEIVKDFVSETNNYNKKVTMLSKIEKMKIQIKKYIFLIMKLLDGFILQHHQ